MYMYIHLVIHPCFPQLLQNDLEVTKVGLDEVLPAATIMVVSVTASTTQGYVVFMNIYVHVHCT